MQLARLQSIQNFTLTTEIPPSEIKDRLAAQGTRVCQYNWHSAGSLGWPFPVLKSKYIFQIKHTEAILSNSTQTLLWLKISKTLIAV